MRHLLLASLFLVACSSDDSSTLDGAAPDGGGSDGTTSGDVVKSDAPAAETGPTLCGGAQCKTNEVCFKSTSCVCADGFVPNGTSGCVAAPSGSPAAHAQSDVCARWKAAHAVTANNPYTAGTNKCDPGTLSSGGITDTLVRINGYRWITGLNDTVTDNSTKDAADQACAIIAVWNPAGPAAHNPPTNSVCYNASGAGAAGQSNISWGVSSAQSIDEYVQDTGNDATLGHRRWVLHPPLGVVGIGWVQASGTQYGSAGCLGVFDTSGPGPTPTWYSWPPEGYFPDTALTWQWSFHFPAGMNTATATVTDMSTNKPITVTTLMLPKGYGDDTLEITPPKTGLTTGNIYRVTVTPDSKTPIVYEIRPFTCQ